MGHSIWGREGLIWLTVISLIIDIRVYFFLKSKILSLFPNQRELKGQDPWNLFEIVDFFVKKTGISFPKIIVLEDETPQAFALGKSQSGGVLIFTEGLLKRLLPEEVKAIVSYQMACLFRSETLIFSIAYFLCEIFFFITFFFDAILAWILGPDDEKRFLSNRNHLFTYLTLPILWLPLRVLVNPFNYYALDRLAASYTKDPKTLAQVLWKVDSYSSAEPLRVHPKVDHFFVVSNLSSKTWTKHFRSHPNIDERVKRLMGQFPI